jgi:adenylate cyclase class IV
VAFLNADILKNNWRIKMNKVESNMEVEYKYWATNLTKEEFHSRIEAHLGKTMEPFYVVSCDDYYMREGVLDNFVRHRKGGGQTELTLKRKRKGNTVRKEINLNVTGNDDSAVVEFLRLSGYRKAFAVFKEAWIFHFDDCDVSYYTLSDGRSVVEVEAVNYDNVTDGVSIIDSWAKWLNLGDLERESRSLFEIFAEEKRDFLIQQFGGASMTRPERT